MKRAIGRLVVIGAAVAAWLSTPIANAQPANDGCGAAVPVTSPSSITGTNVLATADGTSSCGMGGDTWDVWYSFMAPVPGVFVFDTENSTGLLDTTLAVFATCGGTELACDDDGGTDLRSRVSLPMTSGQTVRIRVSGYAAATGGFKFNVRGPNPVPANDLCGNATVLQECVESTGSNQFAGTEGSTSCGQSSADIYYTFIPAASDMYSVSLCGTDAAADTVVSVHAGCPAMSTNELACNDDFCGRRSKVTVSMMAGLAYRIRVAGHGGTGSMTEPLDVIVCRSGLEGACCTAKGKCYACSGGEGYIKGLSCTPQGTCPKIAACCVPINNGVVCEVIEPSTCGSLGGTPLGRGVTCDPQTCGHAQPPIPYDPCPSPLPISAETAVFVSTVGATSDLPFSSCGLTDDRDVWFTFTPPVSDIYRFDTVGPVGTTPLTDTTIAVYAGCGGPELACNDNVGSDTFASVSLNVSAGVSYRVRLAGANHTTGQVVVRVFREALGACCQITGGCVLTYQFACGGPSAFQGHGVVCAPTLCPALGACCRGSTCSLTMLGACVGANSRFVGTGVACNAPANLTTPCCRADFNQSGTVSVQDVFDYLAAFFGGQPSTDINGSGTVTVQDLFDFLAAYFAGCP